MPTFRLTLEYDGADFSGWQIQPGVRTVQGVLEAALATVLGNPVRVQGAGRTDAGVHALGQVASFHAETDRSPERIAKSLNGLCRPDLAAVEAALAPDRFNARFDASGKHYRYQILCGRAPSPLSRRTYHFVPAALDPGAMQEAASRLVGERDFSGFRASDCGREHTVCRLDQVQVIAREGGALWIDVRGVAFLKNMVRIIAGTLIDVGLRRRPPAVIDRILESGDRRLAGATAPPHGLTLMAVFYPEGWLRRPDPNPTG